jgi:hypothetical protein
MTEALGGNILPRGPETSGLREKLSSEQMGNLISAVGNSEAKAITLISMMDGAIYGNGDSYRKILNIQGKQLGWQIGKSLAFKYCSGSLEPVGLVTMETINQSLSAYGYMITEEGKESGVPLSGLLLDFSEKHNVPLSLLFGNSGSNSELRSGKSADGKEIKYRDRTPMTTLKILNRIYKSQVPVREVDLLNEFRDNKHIFNDLIRLKNLGLIQYDATEVNKPYAKYKLTNIDAGRKLPIYRRHLTLTKSVFDILQNHPDQYLTSQEMYALLPEKQMGTWNAKVAQNEISGVLSFLAKCSFAEIEKFSNNKQSDASVTEEQRLKLGELLEIIDKFQSHDEEILKKGHMLAREIIANPNRVSNFMRRAKEASSWASRSSPDEIKEKLISIVLSSPNITVKETRKFLQEKYEKKIGTARINQLYLELAKEGIVKITKEGRINRYDYIKINKTINKM